MDFKMIQLNEAIDIITSILLNKGYDSHLVEQLIKLLDEREELMQIDTDTSNDIPPTLIKRNEVPGGSIEKSIWKKT